MSIVLIGSTSGSCTLQEQAVAGTSVITLPVGTGTAVVNGVNGTIVSGTAVASTSGTAIDFTGIPSWAKRITVMLSGVSLSGTDAISVQIGDSGGIETTGYAGYTFDSGSNVASFTTGFWLSPPVGSTTAASTSSGNVFISNISGNTWVYSSTIGSNFIGWGTGTKTLSDVLTQVRITRTGTNTFDAGSINILYE
jgi:hypothetical protein